MYYEINVSKDGKHYFATAERSILDMDKLRTVYNHFKKLFPESEGYKLSALRRKHTGELVTDAELKGEYER